LQCLGSLSFIVTNVAKTANKSQKHHPHLLVTSHRQRQAYRPCHHHPVHLLAVPWLRVGLTRQAGFAFPSGTHVHLRTLPYHCFWLMEKLSERSNITFLDMNKLEHLKKFLVSKKEKGGF